jgi:hypothetical protein
VSHPFRLIVIGASTMIPRAWGERWAPPSDRTEAVKQVQPSSTSSREGDADMSLLSRFTKFPFALSILLAMYLVPLTETAPSPERWLTATPAWAGGSPDETLNPPTTPRGSRQFSIVVGPSSTGDQILAPHATPRASSSTLLRSTDRWTLLLRICLSSVLRF